MASTNKTETLELNQWLETDHPKREDFNADNEKIDAFATGIAGAFHPAIPNADTGTWWVWDVAAGDYADTGEPFHGEPGADGEPGPNTITEATTTNLTGILKADGGRVTIATAGDFVTPPITLPVTLLATNWAAGTYTIESEAIKLTSDVTISLAETATPIQSTAWAAALPRSGELSAGSVSITSISPPSVDIPVVVRVESGSGFVRVENSLSDMMRGAASGVAALNAAGEIVGPFEPVTKAQTWMTGTLINGATGTLSYVKVGPFVVFNGNITPNTNAALTVANLPAGYKSTRVSIFASVGGTSAGRVASVCAYLATSGDLLLLPFQGATMVADAPYAMSGLYLAES